MVASTFAVSTGGRCGTTMTEVSSRSDVVLAARKACTVSISMTSALKRMEPSGVYGYGELASRGMTMWSLTVTMPKPRASPCLTSLVRASGVACSPLVGALKPMFKGVLPTVSCAF